MAPDDARLALVWAAAASPHAWRVAVRCAGSAPALAAMPARELDALGLDAAALRRFDSPDLAVIARWREWLATPAHGLLTLGSPGYPERLAEIPDAPLALWTLGANVDLLEAPQIAVVGSRNPTAGGCATAEAFAHFFSMSGVTVVSGLALGIDSAAHCGALRAPAQTVAVLGSGIDEIYPRCNAPLAAQIVAKGLIVSEYAPGIPARAHHFPQRNRIIAGLTLGTLVVEATRRSGSLITARLATDYGREVFAVPGSIHNPLSRGCHWLLRQGATLVEDGVDVLAEFAPLLAVMTLPNTTCATTEHASFDADSAYAKLLDSMGFAPTTTAQLMARAGLTAAELSSMLLLLELDGHIEALPGGRYCRLVQRSE
jgi:DNA processing protein